MDDALSEDRQVHRALRTGDDEHRQAGNGAGFRRGRNPGINRSQQQDDDQQQSPYLPQRAELFLPGETVGIPGRHGRLHQDDEPDIEYADEGHQDPGDDPAGEERADGFVRQRPIEDQDDARRDQDGQRPRKRHDGPRHPLVILPAEHLWKGQQAHRRGPGGAGAAHGAENGPENGAGHSQAPGHTAQKTVGHVIGILAHFAVHHDLRHQDKQRHADQGVTAHVAVTGQCHSIQSRRSGPEDQGGQHTQKTERECHRKSHAEQEGQRPHQD